MLKVNTADVRALGGQFSDLADELNRASAVTAPSGPSWQPSATAIGDVSRSIDHVGGECARALTDFGAEQQFFTVSEDLTVSDPLRQFLTATQRLQREAMLPAYHATIRAHALILAATDARVAAELKRTAADSENFKLGAGPGAGPGDGCGTREPTITGPAGPLNTTKTSTTYKMATRMAKGRRSAAILGQPPTTAISTCPDREVRSTASHSPPSPAHQDHPENSCPPAAKSTTTPKARPTSPPPTPTSSPASTTTTTASSCNQRTAGPSEEHNTMNHDTMNTVRILDRVARDGIELRVLQQVPSATLESHRIPTSGVAQRIRLAAASLRPSETDELASSTRTLRPVRPFRRSGAVE